MSQGHVNIFNLKLTNTINCTSFKNKVSGLVDFLLLLKPNEDCFAFLWRVRKSSGLSFFIQCHPLTISFPVPLLHFLQPQGRMEILCHIMGWITVIWFIRLLQITAILQTPTTGCHLWDRKPLVERSLIWPSPGMSEPIMALMKQTEVRKRRKYFFFSVFFPAGLQACFINQLPGEWRHMSSACSTAG